MFSAYLRTYPRPLNHTKTMRNASKCHTNAMTCKPFRLPGVEYVPQLALASRQVLEANRPLVPLLPDVQCSDVRGLSEAVEEQRFELLVTELMDASGLGERLANKLSAPRDLLGAS